MTDRLAVVLPCRNARHLLWRSLASLAAQTRPADQIVVLDRGSTDGLADWLLALWPGVERLAVAADVDAGTVATRLDEAVAPARVAFLQPGDRWECHHLERLAGSQTIEPFLYDTTDEPSPTPLEEALATLPLRGGAHAVDLRAAARPLDLIGLLGLALRLRALGGTLRALTLAELSWPVAEDGAAPLLAVHGAPLDLDHGCEQLCIEQLIRSHPKAPVRLLLGSLRPTTPVMLSRLLDAVTGHPDVELWLTDPVGQRYAASLLGPARVRLISAPILGLDEPLRALSKHTAVDPAMLGNPSPPLDFATRARDHATWWAGYDLELVRRLAPTLAGLAGLQTAIAGTVLQRAWLATLVGWSAAMAIGVAPLLSDPVLGHFVGMCARDG